MMDLMNRDVLWEIIDACKVYTHENMSPHWKKAFEELEHAACVIDAFVARSSVAVVSNDCPTPKGGQVADVQLKLVGD